ncbi:hypothetical protein H4R34_002383 [Dimargaris verticillata]|uniref:PLC-like phosphodiesterase n=1 Tax=Dimargaris verticillata TaxID=2761393 RepID=A0A9W8E9C4_9FUNG|nr:hypothetical protein H4R34_002383 [Dimargaris verticillata]
MLLQQALLAGAATYFLLAYQGSTYVYGSNQDQKNSKSGQATFSCATGSGADKDSIASGATKVGHLQHSEAGSQAKSSKQICPETHQVYGSATEHLLRAPQALLPVPASGSLAAALFGLSSEENPGRSSAQYSPPLSSRTQHTHPADAIPYPTTTQEPRPKVLNNAIDRVYNICQIRWPYFNAHGNEHHHYPEPLNSFINSFSHWLITVINQAEAGTLAHRFGPHSLVDDPKFELLLRALEAGQHVVFVHWDADQQKFRWEYPYTIDNGQLGADCARLWDLMVKPCRVISYVVINGPITFSDVNRLAWFTEDTLAPASVRFRLGGIAQRHFT